MEAVHELFAEHYGRLSKRKNLLAQ